MKILIIAILATLTLAACGSEGGTGSELPNPEAYIGEVTGSPAAAWSCPTASSEIASGFVDARKVWDCEGPSGWATVFYQDGRMRNIQ